MTEYVFLLAQTPYQNRLRGLRGAFHDRETNPTDITMFIALAVALIGMILLVMLLQQIRARKDQKQAPHNPSRLFSRVLKQMGVGLADRLMMRTLAREGHVQQPTVMLFSEPLFRKHATSWLDSMASSIMRNHARRRLKVVANKAFPLVNDDDASTASPNAAAG